MGLSSTSSKAFSIIIGLNGIGIEERSTEDHEILYRLQFRLAWLTLAAAAWAGLGAVFALFSPDPRWDGIPLLAFSFPGVWMAAGSMVTTYFVSRECIRRRREAWGLK